MYVVYVENRSCECMLKIGVVNICCKCSEYLDSSHTGHSLGKILEHETCPQKIFCIEEGR